MLNRNDLFELARTAQSECYRANAAEPYSDDEYAKWNNLLKAVTTVLIRDGADRGFAIDMFMDNYDNPFTLAEFDRYMDEGY